MSPPEDVEDVLDRGPRLKRGALCLVIGLACAVTAYGLVYGLAQPDAVTAASVTSHAGTRGAYRFVGYVTGLAFIVPVLVTWTLLTRRARQQWLRRQIPEARVR